MKIVISTDANYVSAHFGRCPKFTLLNIEHGVVLEKKVIEVYGVDKTTCEHEDD